MGLYRPQPWRKALRRLVYIVPTLIALWFFDRWVSDDAYVGWERNTVRNAEKRWSARTNAQYAIMGSSTSRDWLSMNELAKYLGVPPHAFVDAHINGCHQGCTWASVRQMRQRHRLKRCRWRGKDRCSPPKQKRFKAVFFGLNLFQMCEFPHSKRGLQQSMLLPTEDIPSLLSVYTHAHAPLQYMGEYLGIRLSGALGDPRALRDYWGQKWFGLIKHSKNYLWYRKTPLPPKSPFKSCGYTADEVALKRAFTEALLDDLGELADEVFLMILPDATLSLTEAAHINRWQKHLALHRQLARERPWVHLVDLATDGMIHPNQYRDAFHLKKSAYAQQRKLLYRRLTELGTHRSRSTRAPKSGATGAK
ncbi:MAG: hypothetical protein VX589_19040 [Myxococcota bacterium]|nr:hypothetical protein [Myxococcota bacterium]